MAAFIENVVLGNFGLNLQNLLSVELSDDSKNLLISHSSRGVILFSKELHHLLQQWNVKHGSKITNPAVYSQYCKQFFAVINDKVVWQFSRSDGSEGDSTQKIYGSSQIYQILPRKYNEPLLVLRNGSICSLSEFKNFKAESDESKEIVFCDFIEDQKTKDTNVYILLAEKENLLMATQKFIGPDKKDMTLTTLAKPKYISCSFCLRTKQVIFFDRSGEVSSWDISLSSPMVRPLFRIPNISVSSTVHVLNNSYLAVSGITESDNSKTDGIAIYCLKFGTRQAWKEITNASKEMKVLVKDDEIFVQTKTSVEMLKYECKPSTVGATIGKGAPSESLKRLSSKMPSEQWKVMKNVDGDAEQKSPVDELILKLSDSSKIKDPKQFHKILKDLVENIDEHVVHVLASSFLNVWQRCLKEKNLWSRKEIMPLIRMKLVPTTIYKELFEYIIIHNEVVMLCTALQSLPNIPESIMVQCLEYFIGADSTLFRNKALAKIIGMRKCDSSEPFHENQAGLINTVLFLPYNDVFLQDQLVSLKFDHALVFLRYLYNLLLHGLSLDIEATEAPVLLLQIIEWLCLVLDGHFAQLILSDDSHKILHDLDELIKQQRLFYGELLSLEVLLSQLKSKAAIPQKHTSGLYNIHVLHIY